jgi:HIRAN domain-containing protein
MLEHEPDNPRDINAIRVLRKTGEQVGYLERELAGEVVFRSRPG